MDSNLNQIELFREVVLAGSFSKAAARLRMPKSRVSRHIAQLERDLKVQLIYRTTRQFHLTQTGIDLFQRTSPLLNELKNTLEQITQGAEEIAGILKITVPEDIGSEWIGKICHEFMMIYPRIEIGVFATNQVVDLVKESVDVALRIGPVRDSTMIRRKVGQVGLVLLASPQFLERHANPTRLSQLEALPFISFSPASHGKRTTLRMHNGTDTQTLKFSSKFTSNNFFVLRSMAMEGMAIAPLPIYLAREAIANGKLVHLVKDWHVESSPVQILVPQQKEIPAKVRVFVDFLAQRLTTVL